MRIAILGAGSIGCYVGGRLCANGENVVFYGRPRIGEVVSRHGLTLNHFALPTARVRELGFATSPDCLAGADVILVTVKSQATAQAGVEIRAHADARALVVSLQNGVRNTHILQQALPGHEVAAGMVPFNVVNQGDGVFHCGSEGRVMIARGMRTDDLIARLNDAGIGARSAPDMAAVHWGKLIMNLNNALNLLADLPLKQQLSIRDYRRVLALSMDEALRVLRDAGIRPARVGKVVPRLMPTILRLPDFAFALIARGMLRIDPQARSSMWEDLHAGRQPEIDYLNGEITRLGHERGVATPVSERIIALVREAFADGASPALGGRQLLDIVRREQGQP